MKHPIDSRYAMGRNAMGRTDLLWILPRAFLSQSSTAGPVFANLHLWRLLEMMRGGLPVL